MAISDDVRKTLTDPTPLYFVAGTADLAAQRLKEVPTLVEKIVAEAPDRVAAVRQTDPKAVQDRMVNQAREAQERLTELLGSLDTDLRKVRDTAQDLALQGVGRAAEFAVRARERYDEVAEHGQQVVRTWRGEAADEAVEAAAAIEPEQAGGAGRTTSQPVPVTAEPTTGTTGSGAPAAEKKTTGKRTAAKPAAEKPSAEKPAAQQKTTPRRSAAKKSPKSGE